MQYIEHILYWAGDNIVLSLVLGYLAACIESFIPALPIMAIAAINAAINGLVGGFFGIMARLMYRRNNSFFIGKKASP